MHFWLPLGIIEKIRKICFKFLWSGNQKSFGLPWTYWKNLENPKSLGGWGLKVPAVFAKALVAKNVWNIIHGMDLWVNIAVQKYIHPLNILEWIRTPIKKKTYISICWKAVLWAFDIVGNFLVWNIGNGNVVCIGVDPWIGCKWRHTFPSSMIEKLHW